MPDVRIETVTADMIPAIAAVLARAFVSNPLHVAAFGANQLAKNEAFFRIGLTVMKGSKYVARDGSQVVGFIHWVHAPACQFSTIEKLTMTPAMIGGFGLRSAVRVGSWLSAWARHDPHDAHSHLGPIGVAPEAQRRHIGRFLMEQYCQHLDQGGHTGYLETDRRENVDFYARFGFEVIAEIPVLGVPNFLMNRQPRRQEALAEVAR
jgi:predicted N-acetyltransferase YhbS